jgi:hypothetical protein
MAINPLNESNASALRKYFYEFAILALTVSVVTLFYLYINLHGAFRTYISVQNVEQLKVIQQNTSTIEKNTEVIKQTQQYLIIQNNKQ